MTINSSSLEGVVTTLVGSSSACESLIMQRDGKILLAGYSQEPNQKVFTLVRYNSNGALDSTFNYSGIVTTNFGNNSLSYSVIEQPDGKILLAGTSTQYPYWGLFTLVRYNSNGNIDSTFGIGGKVTTDVGSGLMDYIKSIAIQPDGKILAAGGAYVTVGKYSREDFAVVRYNSDGSLDNTFGNQGKVITNSIGDWDSLSQQSAAESIAVQRDGKILVAGVSQYGYGSHFALVRYNIDGSLDATFSNDGKLTTDFQTYVWQSCLTIQSDDKILVGGYDSDVGFSLLVRYDTDGRIDTTFGTNGIVKAEISNGLKYGSKSITTQNDGKIISVGSIYDPSNGNLGFALIRFSSDGSLDSTFGIGGKVTVYVGSSSTDINSVTIQPDGKILVAGTIDKQFAVTRFNENGVLDVSFADFSPPSVSSFSPAFGTTGIDIGSDIVVTFSEAIKFGTGNIEIRDGSAAGTIIATYNVASPGSNLSISGSTLTINPTNDLAYSKNYYVTFASGAIKDIAGNNYAGTSTYDFTTVAAGDTTAPTVATFSPTDGLTNVRIGSNIVVTFSEAIKFGTGNIEIRDGSAAGAILATYDVASPGSNLSISGSTLTINPTSDLAYSKNYYVTFASGAIKDIAGNNVAAITTYDFTTREAPDNTAPTVSTFSPTDGLTNVAIGSNIVVTFSEAIKFGTGNIEIHDGSATGAILATYNVASPGSNLSISGSTLTINPTSDLGNSKNYYVTFASGAIKDIAGNNYAGISTYDFTTVAAADTTAPTVATFSPTDGLTNVAINSNIVVTFSEAIKFGTGNIEIRDGSATGAILATYNVASPGANLSISGSTLTINPTNDLGNSKNYYVTFASGAIKDIAGNNYTGTSTYDFRTVASADTTAPTVATFSPTDGLTNVAINSNIVVTFSEAIKFGTGNILIRDGSASGAILATYNVASPGANLSISGSTLTINPTNDLGNSKNYYVTFASGAIKDIAGNNYAGITNYDFTTVAAASSAINGTSGNDTLTGNANANVINGLAGNDTLNGGAGVDTLVGGLGNDTYVVDSTTDTITENASEGTDLVQSSVTFSLASILNVENLTLTGSTAINGTGNTLNNTITGNTGANSLSGGDGNDFLFGGLGNDTLTGGAGVDHFVFNTALNASSNKDTITDFVSGTDKIDLENAVMSALGLTTGSLTMAQFFSSSTAVRGNDATDRIIYNSTTGALYYDADGSGNGAAVQIALMGLSIHPTMTYQDFLIV